MATLYYHAFNLDDFKDKAYVIEIFASTINKSRIRLLAHIEPYNDTHYYSIKSNGETVFTFETFAESLKAFHSLLS